MAEPDIGGKTLSNVSTEHEYRIRCVLGASTAMTYRSKSATVTRPTTTTLVIALPQSYKEITGFFVGQKAAAGVIPLAYNITTNAVTTTGLITLTSCETAVAGNATAGAAGDEVYITLAVSRDVLNDRYIG